MRKIVIGSLVFLIMVGLLIWKFAPINAPKTTTQKATGPYELTIWGLWEDEGLFKGVIDQYKKIHPNAKITYNHQTSLNYRTRVQTQIVNNQGPDIFMLHNTWVPMFLKTSSLSEAPDNLMTVDAFTKTFYPVAKETLVKNNKIYALPTEIDGLALFYNEEILKAANVEVPTTWDQFVTAAAKMTVKDQSGVIKTAGAALGTTNNVDHWSDIIGLLFYQQPGVSLENPASGPSGDIIRFYTNFAKDPKLKVWDETMESSTQAFYSGRLGFYLAPSWRAYEIRTVNPNLKFRVAPVPQLPGGNAAWASFWAFGVSKNSKYTAQAWDFINFLTSKEIQKYLYQEASKQRLFGQPYSRVDLQGELTGDPIVGAFVNQGPIYKSWYLSSRTGDAGINDEMIKYFEDALNATYQGADPAGSLRTTQMGVKQVLDKYTNIAPTQSTQ